MNTNTGFQIINALRADYASVSTVEQDFGPEIFCHTPTQCPCSAYPEVHRANQGICTVQPLSPMDQLLADTQIPGYKDETVPVLHNWIDRVILDASQASGVKAYHRFVEALRWIMNIPTKELQAKKLLAKRTLAELYLSQSNTEPSEWWKDQYTGETDPEAADEMDVNRRAQKFIKDEDATVMTGTFTVNGIEAVVDAVEVKDSILAGYLAIYPEEEARRMANLARKATISSGNEMDADRLDEDEEPDGEDRKFTPPPLIKDFNPDMSMIDWTISTDFRRRKSFCWKIAYEKFPVANRSEEAEKAIAQARVEYFRRLWDQPLWRKLGTYDMTQEAIEAKIAEIKKHPWPSGYDDDGYPTWALPQHKIDEIQNLLDLEPVVPITRKYKMLVPATQIIPEHLTLVEETVVRDRETVPVRDELISYANQLAREEATVDDNEEHGSPLQAAACMIYPFIDDDNNSQSSALDGVNVSMRELSTDLQNCIREFEDDIVQRNGSMRKLKGDDTKLSLKNYDAATMKAYEDEMFNYCEAERSFPYVLAHIAAISSGATDKEAVAAAWKAWRMDMSKKGARQYDAVLDLGGKVNAAWAAFWKECSSVVPRPKSMIASASATEVKIIPAPVHFKPAKPVILSDGDPIVIDQAPEPVEPRAIGWGIAVNKLKAGELDLTNKDKILQLKKYNWPAAGYFLHLLETM